MKTLPNQGQRQVPQQENPYSLNSPCSNHKPALPKPAKELIHIIQSKVTTKRDESI